MNKTISIGVDIGGSHIKCAAIDLISHQIIPDTTAEEKINNKASSEEILNGWCTALANSISSINCSQLAGIGFAMPGPFDYPNGIALFERVEKYENLYGINISQALRGLLHLSDDVHFRYINDATSFAIAEAWIGKASKHTRLLALTLGTGFGSAFINSGTPVIEGDLVPSSGCVWHLPFKEGIADDYFSTRWFEKMYLHETGHAVNGVKPIADLAKNNVFAASLFEEYGRNMGIFLAPWVKLFNADVIVIGGNITGSYNLFGPKLRQSFNECGINTEILISELKENAAIIGSARLVDDNYWPSVKNLLSKM